MARFIDYDMCQVICIERQESKRLQCCSLNGVDSEKHCDVAYRSKKLGWCSWVLWKKHFWYKTKLMKDWWVEVNWLEKKITEIWWWVAKKNGWFVNTGKINSKNDVVCDFLRSYKLTDQSTLFYWYIVEYPNRRLDLGGFGTPLNTPLSRTRNRW